MMLSMLRSVCWADISEYEIISWGDSAMIDRSRKISFLVCMYVAVLLSCAGCEEKKRGPGGLPSVSSGSMGIFGDVGSCDA